VKKLLTIPLLILATALAACAHTDIVYLKPDTVHDTVVVVKPHTDTMIVTRVDTVLQTKTDTVLKLRVDTVVTERPVPVPGPVQYDTTFIQRWDTVTVTVTVYVPVPTTDTLYLPSTVVHDTTWVYTQTDPTNPLAGGDPKSGIMALMIYEGYAIVFWHGHFVGVVRSSGYGEGLRWWAWLSASPGQMVMPRTNDVGYATLEEALKALTPIVIEAKP
jgi:hypothetical protein